MFFISISNVLNPYYRKFNNYNLNPLNIDLITIQTIKIVSPRSNVHILKRQTKINRTKWRGHRNKNKTKVRYLDEIELIKLFTFISSNKINSKTESHCTRLEFSDWHLSAEQRRVSWKLHHTQILIPLVLISAPFVLLNHFQFQHSFNCSYCSYTISLFLLQ